MPKSRKKAGFTLIELIVVIAIIVILIALVAPSASALIGTSRQARADANAKAVYTASQSYMTSLLTNGEPAPELLTDTDVAAYLTPDYKKAGEVAIVTDGYSVTQVTVTDGDAIGVYPSGGETPASDRLAERLSEGPLWTNTLKGYFNNSANVRYVDSTSPDASSSGSGNSWSKQIKDYIDDTGLTSTGSWVLSGKNKPETLVLLWTEEDIKTKAVNDPVSAKKYVWNSEQGKFVYDSTVTAKVGTSTTTVKYNVLREA